MAWEVHVPFVVFSSKGLKSQLIYENTSEEPTLRGILQNAGPESSSKRRRDDKDRLQWYHSGGTRPLTCSVISWIPGEKKASVAEPGKSK